MSEGDLVERLRKLAANPSMSVIERGAAANSYGGFDEWHSDRTLQFRADLNEAVVALTTLQSRLGAFAALATMEGRRPCKIDGVDPSTTEGRPFDDSSDDARIALLVRVGDIRNAANCLSRDAAAKDAEGMGK